MLSSSKTKIGISSSLTQHDIPTTISNPKHRANTPARRSISAREAPVVKGISNRDISAASRNSSGQVWAEDYYTIDFSKETEEEESRISPPAAILTKPRPSPLSADEDSYSARQPQRSLTALLPFRNSNSQTAESPTKVDIDGEFMATLTGDKEGVIKIADRRGGLASWFSGSSAPVTVGVPNMDAQDDEMSDNSPQRPATKLQKRTTDSPTPTPSKGAGGMFNFFNPKSPSKPQTVQIPSALNSDEFLTLDIKSSLFPAGQPSETDPFSPAAFKNLLQNAEGLLQKLQTAYKIRTLSLHELSAEKSAMSEELEEAETRAQCLKSQLDDMAHQMSIKDSAIAELAAELAREKQARAEEKLAREQSIALVKGQGQLPRPQQPSKRGSNSNISLSPSEDLGISGRRRKRASGDSSLLSTDCESGSEFENEADSVFSRCRSPTETGTGPLDNTSTAELLQASVARVVPNPGRNSGRPKLTQQRSTFQKILSGMGSTAVEGDVYGGIGLGEQGCSNCREKDASVAWDTVGLMRAENKGLKERVGELEGAVEGALDLVAGLV